MKKFFQGLLWPAIAGNVVWAIFTVILSEPSLEKGHWERIAALIVLGVYLAMDWVVTEEYQSSLKCWYWVGDAFHAPAIAVFAIAAQLNATWLEESLTCIYVIAIVFHIIKVWEPKEPLKKRNAWLKLFGINLAGIGFVWIPSFCFELGDRQWNLAVSLAIVTLFWNLLRKKIYAT